jgi:hypothetical protein
MAGTVQDSIDAIAPEYRPRFDRLQALTLEVHPEADVVLSYKGTIRLRPAAADAISDDEFRALARAALDG